MKTTQVNLLAFAALSLLITFRSFAGNPGGVRTDDFSALDQDRVRRTGSWRESRFRYAKAASLQTDANEAALEFDFNGTGVAIRFGGHNVPSYGPPNLGTVVVTVDGKNQQTITPHSTPREITLASGLTPGRHSVRVEHRRLGELAGCRVESFRSWNDARGELWFQINGEENAHLVDCRAILRCGQTVVRSTLVRNWLTGQCSLTGLPPGEDYSLEIQAVGWQTARTARCRIVAEKPTKLPPVYLSRNIATVISRFRFPRLNQPAIRIPGGSFRARFLAFDAKIDEVTLTRKVGPAVISRVVAFKENQAAAYYYDREIIVTLPADMPPGVYDLAVQVTGVRRTGVCHSPRSVHVVREFPTNPVFVTFGHLDTSAQYQAEYLRRLVSVTNVLAPDMVLCSNACNPAYVSGALADLDAPYVINFGNHQFPGHEAWYGDPVGLVDFGPHVSVLNFGYPWHTDKSKAEGLLASRPKTTIRIINAFEANAPLEMLDTHQVRLIHDAHGIGKKVTNFGSTPTRRIGKTNAESFRVVRFRDGQVESCTYNGHETAPIPFPRESLPPLSVSYLHANEGTQSNNTATVANRLAEAYPNARVRFVVPAGKYRIAGGHVDSQIASDEGRFHVLSIRVDIPAKGAATISVDRSRDR